MISDWLAQWPVAALALAVVFVPGLAIGLALRLRGLLLWAAAPAITTGVLALLAVAMPFLGVRWGMLPVAIGVAMIAVLLGAASLVVGRGARGALAPRRGRTAGLLLAAGLVIGGGLNAARLMAYIGLPGALSQTNDAVFHFNALRWISQTGSASSLDVSGVVGASSFYPSAWHAIASLVVTDPAITPIAVNMVALVIAAVVWPLGMAVFGRMVGGGSPLVTALSAALSGGLMAFPQLMFEWGVLYPYALSIAVLPVTAVLTVTGIRTFAVAGRGARMRTAAGYLIAAVLGVAAIALAQPSSLLAWAALVLLWAAGEVVRRYRRWSAPTRRRALVLLIVATVGVAGAWLVLVYLAGPVLWRSYRSIPGALFDVLLNAHSLLPAAVGMSLLMIVGIVVAVRAPRGRWLVVAWAGLSLLYVIGVATDIRGVKRVLTGPWYGDSFRLTAMVPIVVVPLAALGLAWVIRAVVRWSQRTTRSISAVLPATAALVAVAVVGTLAVIVSPVVLLRVAAETDEQSRYALNERSYLSADEYALLRRLPETIPDDAVIVANPSTGAAFAYALGERDIIPRTWSPPQTTAWEVLADRMHDAAEDPDVCEALAAYGSPAYVLDFGPGEVGPGLYVMPGMTGFAGRDGFELVDREGRASLYRITACG